MLRPNFTDTIFEEMKLGKSINVHGDEGQGLSRLTEDLQGLAKQNIRFVRLSMRAYAHDYQTFIAAFYHALEVTLREKPNIADALQQFKTQSPTHFVWLVIEHFDRLTDKPTQQEKVDNNGFDIHFLNHLNALRNDGKVALLVTSARLIRTTELYIGGEHVKGSRLEFSTVKPLPNLNFDEIKTLIAQKTNAQFVLSPEGKYLIGQIAAHPKAFDFWEFIADKLDGDSSNHLHYFENQIKAWKNDFENQNNPSINLKINQLEKWLHRWKDRLSRILGITKILHAMNTTIGRIIAAITLLGGAWWQWGENFLNFCKSFFTK